MTKQRVLRDGPIDLRCGCICCEQRRIGDTPMEFAPDELCRPSPIIVAVVVVIVAIGLWVVIA